MRSHEQVFGAGNPFDVADRGVVYAPVFVDPGISLRYGLIPDDVAGRRSHDNVDVSRTFGHLVDVVA